MQLLPLLHLGLGALGLSRRPKALQHRVPQYQLRPLDQDCLEALLLLLVLSILLEALVLVQQLGELLRHRPQVL